MARTPASRPPPADELTATEARRITIVAQGLAAPRPAGGASVRDVRRVLGRLHLLQIDSVAAVARSHYLPLQARLGAYDRSTVDDLAYRRRELFEYWGHAASYLRIELHPLLRWRMERGLRSKSFGGFWNWAEDHRPFIESMHARIAAEGPLPAGDLDEGGGKGGSWWGWSDAKRAVEYLFYCGRVSVAARRNFARLYDVSERVIPANVLAAPTPPDDDAHRELVLLSAQALGIGSALDLGDYFRIGSKVARARLEELVEAGTLRRVRVVADGSGPAWRDAAYVDPALVSAAARAPRDLPARALLSPFDPLVFERRRTERMFRFRYRLEMYTPEPKRIYGYYVMPFLLGDAIAARVDVRADRGADVLRVPGAFLEPGHRAEDVAGPLAAELRVLAAWLGLRRIVVGRRGDLVSALRADLRRGVDRS